MNFINNLFNIKNQTCPRCLGKGSIDENDLKRLEKVLFWGTGTCAYCNGNGKVSSKMIKNLPAETTYLTTSINQSERKKLFKNDKEVMYRAYYYHKDANDIVNQIAFLHFKAKLQIDIIQEFMEITDEVEMTDEEKERFLKYINKVIEHKKTELK